MKNRFVLLVVVAVSLSGLAKAQEMTSLVLNNHSEAKIPFKFYVAEKTLPAGDYHIDIGEAERVMMIHTWDAKSVATGALDHAKVMQPTEKPMLIFDKVGDQYFLREVSDQTSQQNFFLPEPNREKSLLQEKAK